LDAELSSASRRPGLVDHVEPHKGDPAKFWNAELWQPSCKWHHDLVKQILERAFARGKLKVADLWLSSAAAVRLTMAQLPMDASDR
jgi:5-methylcytosine-specific restriction protein A